MTGHELLTLATPVLAAVALAGAAWFCLPDLLKLAGITRFRNGIRAGPEGVALEVLPEQHAALGFQLLHLGFKPLGVYWESDDPRRTFTEYVFASRREECYAVLYGFTHTDARLSFVTAFADGAQIHTKNFNLGVEADEADLYAEGIATNDLRRVLTRHREATARFAADGHPAGRELSLEEYARFQYDYYYHAVNYPGFRKGWWTTLLNKAAFLGLCFAVPLMLLGWEAASPAPWLGLLAGCLVCLLVRRMLDAAVARAGTAGEDEPFGQN
jgi:hypothetical protein